MVGFRGIGGARGVTSAYVPIANHSRAMIDIQFKRPIEGALLFFFCSEDSYLKK